MTAPFDSITELKNIPTTPPAGTVQLFDDGGCIYAHRCRIALNETHAAHEIIRLPIIEKPDWYSAIHPEKKVPALRNGDGKVLTDSVHICHYIADAFTSHINLLPGNAWQRAEILLFIQHWHDLIWGYFPKILMEGNYEKRALLKLQYLDAMQKVNTLLLKHSKTGPWVFGETFTLADVVAAPHLSRLFVLTHFENWQIPQDDERFARILTWKNATSQRNSVIETSLPAEEYLLLYQNFINLREQQHDTSTWQKPVL